MRFTLKHCNINVLNLEKSLEFYKEALGLQVVKEIDREGYKIRYLSDEFGTNKLELTWLVDQKEAYDLGSNESHVAFSVDNFEEAYAFHKKMDCICFENKDMGLYFIEDPDGYWLEILPDGRG